MWDFSTEPEFQAKLNWMDTFVRNEVEPLDHLTHQAEHLIYSPLSTELAKIVRPLQDEVREHGLWACHLGPELGGQGYGQVKLALINEILGRTAWGPVVFGCQAPDTGNAEILAMFGTDEQKRRYLQPLLDGEIFSSFSMTEPQGGADPRLFRTRAVQDGEDWIINGEKYFTSNARNAAFFIVMAVTDPDAGHRERMSMFLVPAETPGIERIRETGTIGDPLGVGNHPHIRYTDVRVGSDALLGERGKAFHIAQARLAGGRLHHAMRSIGFAKRAFDMHCERALSRTTFNGTLADNPVVRAGIADSYIQLEQFRLLVLHAAWLRVQGRHGPRGPRRRRTVTAPARRARRVERDPPGTAMAISADLWPHGRADRGPPGHRRPTSARLLLPRTRQLAHPVPARPHCRRP
jgi:acyl-CoA dehydrogenase